MPTLFALLASRIALLEQEGLYRYKPELVPTAVPQYGTCWYRGTVVPTVPWYHGTYRYQRLPGGFIIVPRYMCPPLHLALWGLMGPSQGCTYTGVYTYPRPRPKALGLSARDVLADRERPTAVRCGPLFARESAHFGRIEGARASSLTS